MDSFVKCVIWPKEPRGDANRYVVVGMIVTSKPIARLEKKNKEGITEWIGEGILLDNFLETIPVRSSRIRTGDATDVLLSLTDL
jgi:hypothetical protein